MDIKKYINWSNLSNFIKHQWFYLLVYLIGVCGLNWVTHYFLTLVSFNKLQYFVRHLETLMIGGALIFFILLHFKFCTKFHIKYGTKEFIFLKVIFYIVLNAMVLYGCLLTLYLIHPSSKALWGISFIYAHLTTWGCLFFNQFFNKRAHTILIES